VEGEHLPFVEAQAIDRETKVVSFTGTTPLAVASTL
jgi:hypothetical protein